MTDPRTDHLARLRRWYRGEPHGTGEFLDLCADLYDARALTREVGEMLLYLLTRNRKGYSCKVVRGRCGCPAPVRYWALYFRRGVWDHWTAHESSANKVYLVEHRSRLVGFLTRRSNHKKNSPISTRWYLMRPDGRVNLDDPCYRGVRAFVHAHVKPLCRTWAQLPARPPL